MTIAVNSCNTLAHTTSTKAQCCHSPLRMVLRSPYELVVELGFEPGDVAYSLAALTFCNLSFLCAKGVWGRAEGCEQAEAASFAGDKVSLLVTCPS